MKKVTKSAPKKAKEKKFKLKKLEVNDSFWDAYDSDNYSSGSDVESIDDYKKDGYHPVFVGETFKNRYRVLKKLGWGAFSTVWFCHDMHQNKFVAIKVQKSGESYYSAAEDEIEILDVIADKWKTEEWKDSIAEYKLNANINSVHCMYMMDHFQFNGPHGKHIGMVFEIMGSNLLTIMKKYDWEGIPVPIARIIARQVLIGLDYLHRLCNVIHTDIKPENAILCPTEQQLMDHLDSVPDHFKTSIKGKVTTGMFFSKEQNKINKNKKKKKKNKKNKKSPSKKDSPGKDEEEEQEDILDENVSVKICDFGNGCWIDHHFTSTIQTRQYRSPEVIIGAEYDETCDLWSYACMMFELITGDYLFNPKSGDTYKKEEDHIAYMIELIGQPPLKWLKTGKRFRKYFTSGGKMKRIFKHKIWKLENVLKEKYRFLDEEAEQLADFLMQALQWRNEDRKTAKEMLEHPWLSMPANYDYKKESEGEGEDAEGEEDEDATPAKTETEDDDGRSWVTMSSDEDSDEADDDSDFEIIDVPK